MTNLRPSRSAGTALLLSAVVVAAVIAHPDDPKAKDLTPPVHGPIWTPHTAGPDQGPQYPSEGVLLMSQVPLNNFTNHGGSAASDCWAYTAPSGREYAILGLDCGTGFVDITDPTNPSIVPGSFPGPCCVWRDMKTYEQHAYVSSECGLGIQVFDLGQIDDGVVAHVGDFDGGVGPASHNVVLNEATGFLYRTGGSAYGLAIYDLSDPASPTWVATWEERYVHDAQVVTMQGGPWAGQEIAFCCSGFNGGSVETGLDILDVTDKEDIVLLARYAIPNGSYSHQGWLSEDQQYFFLGDELDEGQQGLPTNTRVIDVSDLTEPLQVEVFTNDNVAVGHNLFVRGNLIFEANYTSGLRVFDATDPLAAVEVAYFDTLPDFDSTGFSGLWGNSPFYPSGTIIGSDRQRGLFVWRMEVAGDVNLDGAVDVTDLLELLAGWGPCGASCPADLDGDGAVTVNDLLILLANWS